MEKEDELNNVCREKEVQAVQMYKSKLSKLSKDLLCIKTTIIGHLGESLSLS